jgi:hypothetical protein
MSDEDGLALCRHPVGNEHRLGRMALVEPEVRAVEEEVVEHHV